MNEIFISSTPVSKVLNPLVSCFKILDIAELAQQKPKVSASLSFRGGSKPAHALSLDVKKATLDKGVWPYSLDRLNNGSLPVHCNNTGKKAMLLETVKPGVNKGMGFFRGMDRSWKRLIHCIHKADKTVFSIKVSAVINKVFNFKKLKILFRDLMKPIIFNLLNFKFAMPGQLAKPSDRITFFNPELKPMSVAQKFVVGSFINKTFAAIMAPKPLFLFSSSPMSFDVR